MFCFGVWRRAHESCSLDVFMERCAEWKNILMNRTWKVGQKAHQWHHAMNDGIQQEIKLFHPLLPTRCNLCYSTNWPQLFQPLLFTHSYSLTAVPPTAIHPLSFILPKTNLQFLYHLYILKLLEQRINIWIEPMTYLIQVFFRQANGLSLDNLLLDVSQPIGQLFILTHEFIIRDRCVCCQIIRVHRQIALGRLEKISTKMQI